ncbi:hypothetical protein FPT12_11910 [Pseudomonas sp. H3(2019)]|nr:hypothetical protein FPT12_11910 [Pseudomonas sp. H3(2019)]
MPENLSCKTSATCDGAPEVFLVSTATSAEALIQLQAQSKWRAIGFLFFKKSLLYCYFDCFEPFFIGRATV